MPTKSKRKCDTASLKASRVSQGSSLLSQLARLAVRLWGSGAAMADNELCWNQMIIFRASRKLKRSLHKFPRTRIGEGWRESEDRGFFWGFQNRPTRLQTTSVKYSGESWEKIIWGPNKSSNLSKVI